MTRTLTARWVFPVARPPLEGGLVTIRDDKIEAVEPRGTRAADDDLGNVAIIPGLVNAHTHLDLSGARGLIPPTDPEHFTDWLKGVIAYRKTRSAEQVQADIRAGLAECLKSGTTLIGDIASGETTCETNVRQMIFREFIGLTIDRSKKAYIELLSWSKAHSDTPLIRYAVSPHAPYSVGYAYFRSMSWNGWSLAIHTAESPAEMQLIESKSGPFETFLNSLGIWEPGNILPSFQWLFWRTRRANAPKLFVHCNYLPIESEFWSHQSIVYCPRTHAAFGHPPHPFREFLKRGVRVCLGTDSLASNPDLDVLAEARFVHAKYPDFPGDQLLKMVTLSGAESLGWADECGSLEPGKSADLVSVPLPDRDGDPYELLLSDEVNESPRRTLFRGEWRS
jgi:cytosine/adenosine deaminase-related metal-dependent hydrolase